MVTNQKSYAVSQQMVFSDQHLYAIIERVTNKNLFPSTAIPEGELSFLLPLQYLPYFRTNLPVNALKTWMRWL
jgi:hypothetical protein